MRGAAYRCAIGLPSPGSRSRRLLANVLEDAVQHDDEAYNTLNNSCFTNVVRLLNIVLSTAPKLRQWFIPLLSPRSHDDAALPASCWCSTLRRPLCAKCEPCC